MRFKMNGRVWSTREEQREKTARDIEEGWDAFYRMDASERIEFIIEVIGSVKVAQALTENYEEELSTHFVD